MKNLRLIIYVCIKVNWTIYVCRVECTKSGGIKLIHNKWTTFLVFYFIMVMVSNVGRVELMSTRALAENYRLGIPLL
jgi:hypothetical protein